MEGGREGCVFSVSFTCTREHELLHCVLVTCPAQWSSKLSELKNHMEGLLKHRLLGPNPGGRDSVDLA